MTDNIVVDAVAFLHLCLTMDGGVTNDYPTNKAVREVLAELARLRQEAEDVKAKYDALRVAACAALGRHEEMVGTDLAADAYGWTDRRGDWAEAQNNLRIAADVTVRRNAEQFLDFVDTPTLAALGARIREAHTTSNSQGGETP